MSQQVFLSYSSQDKATADVVCQYLESHGIKCWMAPRDIAPGADYSGELIGAINGCQAMVLILTAGSNNSPHVQREVERAVSKRKQVLPFMVEKVELTPQMEYLISASHWLDAITPPLEDHLPKLEKALKDFLAGAKATETPMAAEKSREEKRFVTALSVRVKVAGGDDIEDSAQAQQEVGKRIHEIISRHEGMVVNQTGTEITAVFGYPTAHEDDPERAVRCGCEIIQQVTDQKTKVQVGVNSGWVMIGKDGKISGDAVNLAGELSMQSDGVVLSQRTNRLVEGMAETTEINVSGNPAFKLSKLRQEKAYRVHAELVGRQRELNLLKSRLAEVEEDGKGAVVYVVGDPGIGKTRLCDEFTLSLTSPQGEVRERVFRGRCLSYGQSISYWPFLEIIKGIFGIAEMDSPDEIRKKVKEKSAKLFGERIAEVYPYIINLLSLEVEEEFQDKVKYLEPKALKTAQFCAVKDLFLELAKDKPMVFYLEDWHWCDAASAELFGFILNSIDNGKICLLCSLRPEKESTGYKSMELTSRQLGDRAETIRLKQLGSENSQKLMENIIPGMPQNLKDLILKKTEGNPFFIEEIIRSLIDKGTIRKEGDVWNLTANAGKLEKIDIPDRVELLIASRISRLTQDARNVLQAAATVGLSFSANIIEHMLDLQGLIDKELHNLEDKDFVLKELFAGDSKSELEYLFKHPLIQAAAYGETLKKNRQEYHLKIGRFIEDNFKDRLEEYYGVVAHHYYEAEEWGKALEYYLKAGERAKKDYANEQAIESYQKAIEIIKNRLPDKKDELFNASIALGKVYNLIGNWQEAISLYKSCIGIAEGFGNQNNINDMLYTANLELADTYRLVDKHDEALQLCESCIGIAENLGNKIYLHQAIGCLGIIYQAKYDNDKAIEMFSKKMSIAQEIGDKQGIGSAMRNIGYTYRFMGEFDKALELTTKSIAIAKVLGDKDGISFNYSVFGDLYADKGDYDKALDMYTKGMTIAQEMGSKIKIKGAYGDLAFAHTGKGDYDKALDMHAKELSIAQEMGYKSGISGAMMAMGILYCDKGDYDKGLELITKSMAITQSFEGKVGIAWANGCMGTVLLSKGNYDRAFDLLTQYLIISQEIGDAMGIEYASGHLGKIYYEKGDYNKAIELYSKSITIGEETGSKGYLVECYHDMVKVKIVVASIYRNDYNKLIDEASNYVKKGMLLAEDLGNKVQLALANLTYGIFYRETGDFKKADDSFIQSISIYADLKRKKDLADSFCEYAEMLGKSGNKCKALEQYNKALGLYKEMKLEHKVKIVEQAMGKMQ